MWGKEFFNDLKKAMAFSIFPVLTLYSYFVIIGILCIEDTLFTAWITVVVYSLYNLLVLYILIFYIRIIVEEGGSTISLFPHLRRDEMKSIGEDFNPFAQNEILVKKMKSLKKCDICKTYKPPRAHHCKHCDRCYLKLDHHCYFFNSCISFHNYKFLILFFLFNVILIIGTIFICALGVAFATGWNRFRINYIVLIAFQSVQLLFHAGQLSFHINLILFNETIIEKKVLDDYINGETTNVYIFQEGPLTSFTETKDRKVLNPYFLGYKENFKQVFGDEPLNWLLPTFSSMGDGIVFPKNCQETEEYLM